MSQCFGLVLMALLISCAVSPQTITLKPFLDVPTHPIGRTRGLALEVVDLRPSNHFGSRGGIYDTALIYPRTDAAQALYSVLAEHLKADGFTVVPPGNVEKIAMRVEILRIEYAAVNSGVTYEIRTKAAIRVMTRNGERILTSQYQANRTRQMFTLPGEEENEAIINQVVAETLERLFKDKAVIDLLSQN